MEQMTFFEKENSAPLAFRLRPESLDEFMGQQHLLGEGKILRRLIESDKISSMIFWGPPGSRENDAGTYNSEKDKS